MVENVVVTRLCEICQERPARYPNGRARCAECRELTRLQSRQKYDAKNARKCADCGVAVGARSKFCRNCWNVRASQIAAEKRRKHPNAAAQSRFHKYRITDDEWRALIESQGGGCAICGTAGVALKNPLCVDHDHVTGEIRGALCRSCNAAIGHMDDDVERLRAAISYLTR